MTPVRISFSKRKSSITAWAFRLQAFFTTSVFHWAVRCLFLLPILCFPQYLHKPWFSTFTGIVEGGYAEEESLEETLACFFGFIPPLIRFGVESFNFLPLVLVEHELAYFHWQGISHRLVNDVAITCAANYVVVRLEIRAIPVPMPPVWPLVVVVVVIFLRAFLSRMACLGVNSTFLSDRSSSIFLMMLVIFFLSLPPRPIGFSYITPIMVEVKTKTQKAYMPFHAFCAIPDVPLDGEG